MYGDTETKVKKISLQDAIAKTLKNNLDLKIEVINSKNSRESLLVNESIFIPNFNLGFSNSETNRPATGSLDGADVSSNKRISLMVGLEKKFSLGGTIKVELNNSRNKTNSSFSSVNPALNSTFTFSLSQPLLKGFGSLATKKDIYIAVNNLKKSKLQLKNKIIDLIYSTEEAYWNLVYAYQNLEAKKKSLEEAKKFLKQNKRKVEIGTSAPIDILSAKAEVATRESDIVSAEQSIQTQEELLKYIINSKNKNISIIPIDRPEITSFSANFNQFLLEAFNNRPDIDMAKLDLVNYKIYVRYRKNQLLPDLSLQASYYTNGLGGTQFVYAPGNNPFFHGEPIGTIEKSIWDAIKESIDNKYSNYSISLNLKVPLNNKKERAQYTSAQLDLKKSLLALKNLENKIYSEVKNGIKNIQTSKTLFDKNKIALKLQGQKLKAEKMKLSVGLSTNYQVLTFQRDYANSVANKLQAAINYKLSIAKIKKILGTTLKEYNVKFKDLN
jgi:outer membrane protein TolC